MERNRQPHWSAHFPLSRVRARALFRLELTTGMAIYVDSTYLPYLHSSTTGLESSCHLRAVCACIRVHLRVWPTWGLPHFLVCCWLPTLGTCLPLSTWRQEADIQAAVHGHITTCMGKWFSRFCCAWAHLFHCYLSVAFDSSVMATGAISLLSLTSSSFVLLAFIAKVAFQSASVFRTFIFATRIC